MTEWTLYVLLGSGVVFLASSFAAIGLLLPNSLRRNRLPVQFWNRWKKEEDERQDETWNKLLSRGGHPFGWKKAEWISLQLTVGGSVFLLLVMWGLIQMPEKSFPLFTILIASSIGYFLPYFALRMWADYREDILCRDIARFLNRYSSLLENQVPPFAAMVKAARHTRKLKLYVPSLSEWNRDRITALEKFKRDLGIDDAVILVSNMRTLEQLPAHMISVTLQRLERTIDNRRMYQHRKKLKSLGLGYSIIVYPAFYTGLLVAMFPWYKLLSEILDKYL